MEYKREVINWNIKDIKYNNNNNLIYITFNVI